MSTRFGLLNDIAEQAIFSLVDNKLRTTLSIIGVTIGIAAVMLVGSVSQGMKNYIYAELDTYGLNSVWIYRDWGKNRTTRKVRQGSGITNEDLKIIQGGCCITIARATPVVYSSAKTFVNFGSKKFKAAIEGIGKDYLDINNDKILVGRNFSKDDILRKNTVAIISSKAAVKLYGKSSVIGKSFRFLEQKFKVIGLLDDKNRELLSQIGADSYNINGRILIPYTTYQKIMGIKDVHTIQAEATSIENTTAAMNEVKNILLRRHNNRFKYTVESMDVWIDKSNEILRYITLIGLLFATISLIVGGIGIMNIMSTSVVERTREIGIRKALGAKNEDILFQFVMEAAFVSTIGGVLGMSVGTVATYGVSWFSGYSIDPSWIMAVIAIGVSAMVGLLSGYIPARRAASLNPVDALRFE